jgi:STE24 endopeptidase
MNPYLIFVLAVLVGGTAFDLIVEFLNQRRLSPDIPDELKGFVDQDKYLRSIDYQRENFRFATVRDLALLAASLVFILIGGFNWLDEFARSIGERWNFGEIRTGLVFTGLLLLARALLQLPFSAYHTFVIEEKYGFNRTTLGTWVNDLIRGVLVGSLIGGAALAGVLWFFIKTGENAWLYAWLAMNALQLMLLFLAPAFILPLFNKFTPLEEGLLTRAVHEYSEKAQFKLQGVFMMDGSKRSTKSNAFFTGFGKLRRLVLFDTLVEKHTTEELVAVFAHEVGHCKLKHIPKAIAMSFASSAVIFFILSRLIGNPGVFEAFRMRQISVYASFVFAIFFYAPVAGLFSIGSKILSRKAEFEADEYSAKTYGRPLELVNALKKLSIDNMSHLTPHGLKVFVDYTHPPVLARIEALRAFPGAKT